MNRCKKHGAEFWSVNNDWCFKCKWEEERRMDKAERAAAARLERVVERFEKMVVATEGHAPAWVSKEEFYDSWPQDCLERMWKIAERVEAFIEEKRK